MIKAVPDGAAFVPFIGDGDIAAELYADREIWGADIDPARVARANERLPGNNIIMGDCDSWPFPPDAPTPIFAIADFDAYGNPYHGIKSFLDRATMTNPACIIGTDGMKMNVRRGKKIYNELTEMAVPDEKRYRTQANMWFYKMVMPWLQSQLAGFKIKKKAFYNGRNMTYWAIIIEHKSIQV